VCITHSKILQHNATRRKDTTTCLQKIMTYCNVQQIHTANILERIATQCTHATQCKDTARHCITLHHTVSHCITLQSHFNYTATHCNAMQRTATPCNALKTISNTLRTHCKHNSKHTEHAANTLQIQFQTHCKTLPTHRKLLATHTTTRRKHSAAHCRTQQVRYSTLQDTTTH